MSLLFSWESFFRKSGFSHTHVETMSKLFEYHGMEMSMIQELTHELLSDMGVDKVGDRIKILRMQNDQPLIRLRKPNPSRSKSPQTKNRSSSITGNKSPKISPMHSAPEPRNQQVNDDDKKFHTISYRKKARSKSQFNIPKNKQWIFYYINDNFSVRNRIINQNDMDVHNFHKYIKEEHKITEDFAIFLLDEESQLQVVKEGQKISNEYTYYVIYYTCFEYCSRKISKKVKKDTKVALARKTQQQHGKPIYTSDNFPLEVDFVPESELYLPELGAIGLCMAPGRSKNKKKT